MARMMKVVGVLILALGTLWAEDQPERRLLIRLDAEYPPIALKMNLHGSVKLKIWITPDGAVRRLEYVGGHPLLAESALKAVKNWKYAAAAKESTAEVEVKF